MAPLALALACGGEPVPSGPAAREEPSRAPSVEAPRAEPAAAEPPDVEAETPEDPEITGPCPTRMAHVPYAGVCIDRFEAAVDEGRAVSERGRLPAARISWDDARAACEAAGFRLCTIEEWTAACRGEEERVYPYGDEFDPRRCNTGGPHEAVEEAELAPTGSNRGCVTPEGVFDLSGNVMEWMDGEHPTGVIRPMGGGGYGIGDGREVVCVRRAQLWQPPDAAFQGYGFRCCTDPRD